MMNKQEAIKKLKKNKRDYKATALDIHYGNQRANLLWNNALNVAIDIVKELDEPKKPVVPQFVADWYERNKDDLNTSIYSTITRIFMKANDEDLLTAFESWLMCNENSIVTVVSMHQFGYTIKKEKLYTVELPNPNRTDVSLVLGLYNDGKVAIFAICTDSWKYEKRYKLTEAEIKKEFDWAWQFAKEVEE